MEIKSRNALPLAIAGMNRQSKIALLKNIAAGNNADITDLLLFNSYPGELENFPCTCVIYTTVDGIDCVCANGYIFTTQEFEDIMSRLNRKLGEGPYGVITLYQKDLGDFRRCFTWYRDAKAALTAV